MAHRTLSDEEFLAAALDLFRAYGFEGVSMNRIVEATGLEKASLYYRYPGGKEEIVLAVLQSVAAWFGENIIQPLAGEGPARKRVAAVSGKLREFYADGAKSCVTDVLSIPGGPESVKAGVHEAMQAWLKAFADVARESGFSAAEARRRAEEAIVRIEGALIMSRVMGENTAFERALKMLPELLTGS